MLSVARDRRLVRVCKVFLPTLLRSLLGSAVLRRDYPMIQGGLLFVAATLLMLNILVDVLYAYFDPRVRYDNGR